MTNLPYYKQIDKLHLTMEDLTKTTISKVRREKKKIIIAKVSAPMIEKNTTG